MPIRSRAPLRISFAGGGTDVSPFPEREGGLLLNATIDRYAYATLRPRDDDSILIRSLDYGVETDFAVSEPLVLDGKLDLAKAAIRRLAADLTHGFELVLRSDVPPGSGLGASSAMVVAVIGALKELRGLKVGDYELAELAHSIEREELGMTGGRQDGYAATFGGVNFIELHGDRVSVNPLRLPPDVVSQLERSLLLCFTGMTRESDHIIEDQTARFAASESETVAGLRTQKQLALEIRTVLVEGRLEEFGRLLAESWEAKKRTSPKISNQRIDELYDAARSNGAIGGKLAGAGGGGYLLLYCPDDARDGVRRRMLELGAPVEGLSFEAHGLRSWTVDDG
ncbi:MAG: D-glycero-alpha-D-manno-heptose-7-phosphate kinase [Solirubrobacteraceae bacterium]|nr:D-glycero-alpha-D-manno-heptose-7-phosphate kinase [Solirubrobacteraceae bacterium]